MASERVYSVNGATASPAQPVTLAEAGLRERSDLQEWVLAHPEILGAGILVVAFEFDRWQTSSGDRQLDRLDVLGLDTDGRLVVVELKRDRAPDTVEMQAIKYAAMASRFTEEELVSQHARFLTQQTGSVVSEDAAREAILEHIGELDVDQLRQPRIVLVAGSFTPVTTASVVWLTEMGLDITMQRVQAYRVAGDQLIVTVSQLYPVPDVEEFTVSPQRAEAKAKKGTREKSTVVQLVASRALEDGHLLTLRSTNEVTSEVRELIDEWIAQDPRRGRARWYNDRAKPLEWEYDGNRYRPTAIVQTVLEEAAGVSRRSMRGPSWWETEDGASLPDLVGSLQQSSFDRELLHDMVAALPEGRWTTYGDIADLVGTWPQPLGRHITTCQQCVNAQRILNSDGLPNPGFAWSDPDRTDTQREALEAEGVTFVGEHANPAMRLSPDELAALLD